MITVTVVEGKSAPVYMLAAGGGEGAGARGELSNDWKWSFFEDAGCEIRYLQQKRVNAAYVVSPHIIQVHMRVVAELAQPKRKPKPKPKPATGRGQFGA